MGILSKKILKILLLQSILLIAISTKSQNTKIQDLDSNKGSRQINNQLPGEENNKAIIDENFKINIIKTAYGVKVESNEIIEKIDVYDLNGKLYKSFTPKKELVDMKLKLSTGTYIIRVRTSSKDCYKKIEK
ncbi:MAG: T9SS type A sorting domain-containing protein [Bacteroidales bacterium]|jgi:hypothetical protein